MKQPNKTLHRLLGSLRESGVKVSLLKLYSVGFDGYYDLRYRVDTRSQVELEQVTVHCGDKDKGYKYQPSRVVQLRMLFRKLGASLPVDGALVDFGCGKGRVLLVASEFGFKEARGVEFAQELCRIAEQNCRRYQAVSRTKTRFQVIEADAAQYAVQADESVFFLYNPFGAAILQPVLGNIRRSAQAHPRRVLIIYHCPEERHLVQALPGVSCTLDTNIWDCHFVVYEYTPAAG
jgi:predicted RNA methylase